MKRLFSSLASLIVFCGLTGIAQGIDIEYYITDLGTLGGGGSVAYGIDNSGQVVGVANTTGGYSHAFVYSGSTMTDLGTLGGTNSYAYHIGIGGAQWIVGVAKTTGGYSHAFLFYINYIGNPPMGNPPEPMTMFDLGTLGGNNSCAYGIGGINIEVYQAGHYEQFLGVVGVADTTSGYSHAFLRSSFDYVMRDLGTLGGNYSCAYGMNDNGQVVGMAYTTDGSYHAFRYSGSTMTDLGTLDGPCSVARGINNSGQVVGWSSVAGGGFDHAFLYSGSTMTDLHAFDGGESWAYGINNNGQVVGGGFYPIPYGPLYQYAWLYSDSTMKDLNTLLIDPLSGWTLRTAYGINDLGQIVGVGINGFGQEHGFLLTPTPEPSTIAILISGLIASGLFLLCRRKWRK